MIFINGQLSQKRESEQARVVEKVRDSGAIACIESMYFFFNRFVNFIRLSGLSPFVGQDDFETMTLVSLAKYSFDYAPFEEISSTAKDFIEKLLMKEPTKRMKARNALKHEWLTQLDCISENEQNDVALSLTKTKLKRYVILRR
jgi:serine/threonine protein kinase